MNCTAYQSALERLSADSREIVERVMAAWHNVPGADGAQLARNIEAESGLAVACFAELLTQFAAELGRTGAPEDAWKAACENRILMGKVVPDTLRPQVLGRAEKLPSYVRRLAVTGHQSAIRHAIVKHSGRIDPPAALARTMTAAPLGGSDPVWGTFESSSRDDPFFGIPADTASIRTALGLGFAREDAEPFVLLRWRTEPPAGVSLHRPTIADAGTYHYFRPNPDQASPYGKTHPLLPNPDGLDGCPEVVQRKITGNSLVFPYHLTST
jgi:hypothetical protein